MRYRPSYREYYLAQKKGNVIMTQEGRLFVTERMDLRSDILRYLFVPIILILCFQSFFSSSFWLNSFFDYLFACEAIVFGVFLLIPRLLRYSALDPDSADFHEARTWFIPQSTQQKNVSKVLFFILHAVIAAIMLLSLLNSHSVELFRSLFDSRPHFALLEVSHDGDRLYSSDSDDMAGVITLTNEYKELDVYAVVSRTKDDARFYLDGKPLDNQFWNSYSLPHMFWEEYLQQQYDFRLSNIRDGSTLSLTCGGLTREWVFSVADKKAS